MAPNEEKKNYSEELDLSGGLQGPPGHESLTKKNMV
jgi:hypothetical protein